MFILLSVMLASIIKYSKNLPDEDILIFLNDGEIKELENNSLKGNIFESRDVRNIYSLEIKVNEEGLTKYNRIEVKRNPNEYLITISNEDYRVLKEKGLIGTRPDTYFKIDIMSEYAANQDEEFRNWLRNITSRWENRDRIIEKMKREGV